MTTPLAVLLASTALRGSQVQRVPAALAALAELAASQVMRVLAVLVMRALAALVELAALAETAVTAEALVWAWAEAAGLVELAARQQVCQYQATTVHRVRSQTR